MLGMTVPSGAPMRSSCLRKPLWEWYSPPSARVMVVMRPRSSVIWTRSPGRTGPRRLMAPVGVGVPLLTGWFSSGFGSVCAVRRRGELWTEKVFFYFSGVCKSAVARYPASVIMRRRLPRPVLLHRGRKLAHYMEAQKAQGGSHGFHTVAPLLRFNVLWGVVP